MATNDNDLDIIEQQSVTVGCLMGAGILHIIGGRDVLL